MNIEQAQEVLSRAATEAAGSGRSYRRLFRQWAPVVLTALIVPGGLIVAALVLVRRWQQYRQSTQPFVPRLPVSA